MKKQHIDCCAVLGSTTSEVIINHHDMFNVACLMGLSIYKGHTNSSHKLSPRLLCYVMYMAACNVRLVYDLLVYSEH